MTIQQIIEILEKRVICLESQKAAAYAEGNMDLYSEFDMQIQECETSLVILRQHV